MQTPEQRVSDRLRLSRLFDTHANIHRQLADWDAANPGKLDTFRGEARKFVLKNQLKSHREIPFPPEDGIAYVMMFNQNWSTSTEYLQKLLDYTRNDSKGHKYFGNLTAHGFVNRLYEIAHFKQRDE